MKKAIEWLQFQWLKYRMLAMMILTIGWILSGLNWLISRTWQTLFVMVAVFITMFYVGYKIFMETNAWLIHDIINAKTVEDRERAALAAMPMGMGGLLNRKKKGGDEE